MGMDINSEEHDKWHMEPRDMTDKEHEEFMKKMRISKEEDEKWHKENITDEILRTEKLKPINPFIVGGGFLDYCIKQNWIIQKKGKNPKYFISIEGIKQLKKRFSIQIN